MQRREFIGTCSALAVAGLVRPSRAMEPLNRPKPGKLRLSLAAYSMRKYLDLPKDGSAPAMDLFQFVDFCFEHGIPGAELTSYYFPKSFDDQYLMKLKRHCHLRGVTISGGAIANDFGQPEGEKLDKDVQHTCTWVDHYAKLGAPAIRIFAGHQPKGEALESAVKRCAATCERACTYAAERGVLLALENHGGLTATAEGILKIVRLVNSPAFGVNFDSGNFRDSDDPYAELAQIAPYAVNVQIKVEIRRAGKSEEADLNRILDILRNVGYSGWVALEYEAAEDPKKAIPRHIESLKKLMA